MYKIAPCCLFTCRAGFCGSLPSLWLLFLSSLWLLFFKLNSFNRSWTFIVFEGADPPPRLSECLILAIWARKSNYRWVPSMLISRLTSWPLGNLYYLSSTSSIDETYLFMSLYVWEAADSLSLVILLTFCPLLSVRSLLRLFSISYFDLFIKLNARTLLLSGMF